MADKTKETLKMAGIPEKADTLKQSSKFVKRLVTIGFSQILFLRSKIPEHCFQSYGDDRLGLMLIKDKSESEGANKLTKTMKDAMTAFDHGYLKDINLLILTDKHKVEEIFEKYTFNFKKPSEGNSGFSLVLSSPRNLDETIDVGGEDADSAALHKATKNMLSQLISVIQCQDELPQPSYMTIVLGFHDNTPEGYQPPGFSRCTDEVSRAVDAGRQIESIGKMKTKFHGIGIQYSTENFKKPSHSGKKNLKPVNSQLNETLVDMNPGLDTSIMEHSRAEATGSIDVNANVCPVQERDTHQEKLPAKSKPVKRMVPSESNRPSGKGDAGGHVRSNCEAPVNISGVATPAKNKANAGGHVRSNLETPINISGVATPAQVKAKENTPTSQVSLNSTARSPKTLLVQRKAISVRDTFIEDKNDSRRFVKASKCSRMIPF